MNLMDLMEELDPDYVPWSNPMRWDPRKDIVPLEPATGWTMPERIRRLGLSVRRASAAFDRWSRSEIVAAESERRRRALNAEWDATGAESNRRPAPGIRISFADLAADREPGELTLEEVDAIRFYEGIMAAAASIPLETRPTDTPDS